MPLTPEERGWLYEQRYELKRELDELVSGKARSGYTDSNERRIDLLEQLEEIQRQLHEDEEQSGERS
jgi:hypothetical protein